MLERGASRDFSLPETSESLKSTVAMQPPSQRNATYQATLQVEERILERWDKKIHGDRLKTKHSGSISVEGGDDMTGSSSDIEADTPCIVL